MAFTLPPLPFADDALEPYYSAKTISFHYGKHHQAYVDNLNKLVPGTPFEGKTLEEIVRMSATDTSAAGVFNNAAQVWNHTFFWRCLHKDSPRPGGAVLAAIEASFGDFDGFAQQLKTAAVGRFGSGWAWLVLDESGLKVTSTPNADTPIAHGVTPLLTIDVWEHTYYLDYQNRRPDFVQTFIDHLINWEFVAHNLAAAG